MKKVEAIIRPYKLDDVKASLTQAGVQGITISEVRSSGMAPGHVEVYRGREYAVDFMPCVKVEVATHDDSAQKVVEVLIKAARTGQVGDGYVTVARLEDVVRVRTGEMGPDAL